VPGSVLQIEHKELKNLLSKQEEQMEINVRQLEQLNVENADLQNVIRSLENNLSSTQAERDTLHDSLRETNALCSQLESALSSSKSDETKYKQKLDELQNQITQAEAASAAAEIAVAEKEKAIHDLAELESEHQKVIAGIQSQISDSTSQVSKLIDQLSIASGEKATLSAKFESLTMELSTMKDKADAQANKISQLESSLESLNEERDAANSRVAELLDGNAVLPSLLLENSKLVSIANERENVIQSLKAETEQALTKARIAESAICELRGKTGRLAAEFDASKSEISDLMAQMEAANRQQKQPDQSNNEAVAMTKALQLEIDGLVNLKTEKELANQQLNEALAGKFVAETTIKALQSEINELKAVNTDLTKAISTAESQHVSYSTQISDLMAQIEAANRQQKQPDQSNNEAVAMTKALQLEIDGLVNLKTEKELANQQLNEALASKFVAETTIKALQSEKKKELKAVNTDLTKAISTAESQHVSYSTQSTEAIEDLMKDLVEVNSNFQRLKRDHNDEVQKLNAELRELRVISVALEEAVQGNLSQYCTHLR
jgi:chromosome segregation ATPase